MIALIVGLLVCVAIAIGVVGLVAIPARREGRDVLTSRGEDLLAAMRDRTGGVVDAAKDRVGGTSGDVPDAGPVDADGPVSRAS